MLQQAAMPKFRVPFYLELASRPGIDLEVSYASMAIPNEEAPGLKATHREIKELPGGLKWDGEHLRKLRPGAYDAVSLSWNTRYLSLVPAMRKARRGGMGIVLWGHGYSKREGRLREWLRMRIARRADAIALYTNAIAERYIREFGFPREKVFVAQNSVDPRPIQVARAKALASPGLLERFRIDQRLGAGPVFLFVSRLYDENRVDLLLDAAALLAGEFPDLKVVVIGKGPDEDRLKAHAASVGVAGRTRFLGAIYDEDVLAPWFLSATAFCYPQNIGLSILHAMGYGLPVVTSDDIASQNPEIEALRDGENGLLYEHGSVPAMAAALKRLATDRALHARLSAEAHRTATEVYTIDAMADGMEGALRFAAGKAAERRARRRGGRGAD